MPIDPTTATTGALPRTTASWSADDVILYHLGIGAGRERATDPRELRYVYERDLTVLPTFAVVPVLDAVMQVNRLPGIDIDLRRVLHGEQDLLVHRPLQPEGRIESEARVTEVIDKGRDAVLVLEVCSHDEAGLLFTNRFGIFARNEGGFGSTPSSPGATSGAPGRPQREPDLTIVSPTDGHQALLYRLTGDRNPLHADPAVAAAAGFERPILHGLCTFGIVCKAVVDELLEGDGARIGRYRTRFAGIVQPGETLETAVWVEGDEVLLDVTTVERGAPVLTRASITLRS